MLAERKNIGLMEHGVKVRHATLTDLPSCKLLDHSAIESAIRYAIEHQAVVVAECDGNIIGYLRLEFLWSRIPYIGLVWVVESHRDQGVGRSLLSFVETDLRTKGHQMLISSSQVDEPAPRDWHRSVGFVECGVLDGINKGGTGEVFFRKELDTT